MAFPQIDNDKFKADAEKAMAIPLGFASPLWLAYAGMASAGVAYWWMRQFAKPEHFESFSGLMDKYSIVPVPESPAFEAPVMAAEPPAAPSVDLVQTLPAVIEPVAEASLETAAAAIEPLTEATETVLEAPQQAAQAAADDLTRLIGIGPSVAAKLANLGVRTYSDIANWSVEEADKIDRSLNLMGRVRREDWVGQAKQFADHSAH